MSCRPSINMNTNRTYIAGGIAVLALVAIIFMYPGWVSAPTQLINQEAPQSGSVLLSVQGLYAGKQVAITQDETALEVLQKLDAADPQLRLSTKEYAGLGTLVDGMHGLKNGTDKKYWQYKVNGVMPQIGAGAYTLKTGDSVEWTFSASQE